MDSTIKINCHKCKNDTNQTIKFHESEVEVLEIFLTDWKGDPKLIQVERTWLISKCNGCDMLNMTVKTTHIGNDHTRLEFFPNTIHRGIPSWIIGLDINLVELLGETYNAFNKGSYRLSLMGIRASLDLLMTKSVGDIGTFVQKIEKFKEKGFINNTQTKLLETAIDAVSASSHRGYTPDYKISNDLLEFVEHLMQREILENKNEIIKKKIPQREKVL